MDCGGGLDGVPVIVVCEIKFSPLCIPRGCEGFSAITSNCFGAPAEVTRG